MMVEAACSYDLDYLQVYNANFLRILADNYV